MMWHVEVRYVRGSEYPFLAYAVHKNGKVEREGRYAKAFDAFLHAKSFVASLNRLHRYAGKYEGKDRLVGKLIDLQKLMPQYKVFKNSLKNMLKTCEEIAKRRENK